ILCELLVSRGEVAFSRLCARCQAATPETESRTVAQNCGSVELVGGSPRVGFSRDAWRRNRDGKELARVAEDEGALAVSHGRHGKACLGVNTVNQTTVDGRNQKEPLLRGADQ